MNSLLEIDKFNGQVFENEPLANYCTYKIGGPAKFLAKINDESSLVAAINWAKENNIKTFILGGGSNILFADDGFDGLVICLAGDFKSINIDKTSGLCVFGGAVSLAKALNSSLDNKLAAFEFCAGIPGSIGGAVKMNAGRKDHWMSHVIDSIRIVNKNGEVKDVSAKDLNWGYRTSELDEGDIITSVKVQLKPVSESEIVSSKSEVSELTKARQESQPVSKPSCGSVFKNPKDNFAGKLIEDCGLKGLTVGGAQVSDVHANFIINNNNASAMDVVEVIKKVQKSVLDKTGVVLEPELKFVGFSERIGLV